jgi:hypothetical protein
MGRGLILTITGFVLLGALAVAGWVRTPRPMAASMMQPAGMPAVTCYDQNGQQVAWQGYGTMPGVYPAYQPAMNYAYAPAPMPQRTIVQQAPARRVYVRERNYTPATAVVRKRPTKHSVAIVAGSAGAGAAIGALAGGGKGAAIGALSGGAAGFIYDRLTHKKTEYR